MQMCGNLIVFFLLTMQKVNVWELNTAGRSNNLGYSEAARDKTVDQHKIEIG